MKKILTNIIVFLTGYLILLMVACNQSSETLDPSRPDPYTVHTDCTVWQEPSTLLDPQFMGHLEVPDRYFVCGRGDYTPHSFWFVSTEDTCLNLALNVDLEVTANVKVYALTLSHGGPPDDGPFEVTYELLYEFFGDPGYLGVLDAPIEYTNHGFVVEVEVFEPADYQMEIWPGL